MVSNSTLRQNARNQLGGNVFSNTWLMMLVVYLIYDSISGVSSITVIGGIILVGPMLYGVSRVTVNTVRGKPVNIVETFCGFTESFSDSIVLNLLQSIYVALWSLLFFVPGIIKSYAYSMAFYIQQENSNKSASDCLSESQKLMKGHKWQLFCLDLSFIGWYIVGSLCFGVGVFFVIPYHQTARANFYMALTAEEFIG